MLSIKVKTPPDVASELAGRVKARRLELNLTQATFAAKAGLKLPTYRLFERTGQISLRGLLQCGFALDMLADFDAVFAQRKFRTMEEYLAAEKTAAQKSVLPQQMTAVVSSKNISSQPAGTIRCPDEQKQSSGSDKPGALTPGPSFTRRLRCRTICPRRRQQRDSSSSRPFFWHLSDKSQTAASRFSGN